MQKVTAVFDIGKTNKKFFLFDRYFREVHREYVSFPEIVDEDGYPTEDLPALQSWLREVFHRILEAEAYDVRAINFSSYGASLVYLDDEGKVLTPLYNYHKPLDPALIADFYAKYGPEESFAVATGSTNAGRLNAGMQLYWLKYARPEVFARLRYALHLPQYLSYVFTGIPLSEYTSIGCHTALWDYAAKDYHRWVYAEGLHRVLPAIVSTETSINMNYNGRRIKIGVGIHDSSAALLPYIRSERKPFVLVSTGTWSVALNPFTKRPLTPEDLANGCINYLRINGKPVKAARLFLGQEYKLQTGLLAKHYGVADDFHKSIRFDFGIYQRLMKDFRRRFHFREITGYEGPGMTNLAGLTYPEAYHQLMMELLDLQAQSIRSALGGTPAVKLFIDGGFSDNDVYVKLLSHHFRDLDLRTTDASLGSALGAALCIADTRLNSKFLKQTYGLRKHKPFIVGELDRQSG
ncbi:FGGY family carbohydrate kinase [Neolewinella lacunae]|uniref:Carbohydrate kinase n=1 Tax=Neolewinella lacunae TaxID=1517758 RepID=A0A923PLX8_9BACT|nr:FGGY family carbohydrate kinase [Neolewinella lacunae]MBC6996593.1 carbohydrate kinase [Neolewinella lacunae]MDN3634843.1 FGGY family carbohydrate kinase [Neolewinella lacunae]